MEKFPVFFYTPIKKFNLSFLYLLILPIDIHTLHRTAFFEKFFLDLSKQTLKFTQDPLRCDVSIFYASMMSLDVESIVL